MSTGSRVSEEIDAIIARALSEYQNAHNNESTTESSTSQPLPWDTQDIPSENTEEATNVYEVAIDTASESSDVQVESTTTDSTESESNSEGEAFNDLIPENSQSILVSETTSRFSGAAWYENIQSKVITLAGVGGIGSYVAFLLSRLAPYRIVIYDNDTVEAANMSGQLYGRNDIGESKAYSIARFMSMYSDYYGTAAVNSRFSDTTSPTNIMICGFDNMEARKLFFYKWKDYVDNQTDINKKKCLFIDGRLAAESLQIFCITGDDVFNQERYRKEFLFSDEEADETICSYKQTSFMAAMIGALIVNLFVNFCANECDPLIPRDLPFYTEYTAETMFFKVNA